MEKKLFVSMLFVSTALCALPPAPLTVGGLQFGSTVADAMDVYGRAYRVIGSALLYTDKAVLPKGARALYLTYIRGKLTTIVEEYAATELSPRIALYTKLYGKPITPNPFRYGWSAKGYWLFVYIIPEGVQVMYDCKGEPMEEMQESR